MSPPVTTNNLRVRALVKSVPPGGNILDIGCVQHDADERSSDEWVHDYLRVKGDRVVGIDYLADEVDALQNAGYDVVCADAQDFDLGETFETVVAGEIIEHLSDIGGFLDSVLTHLEANGQLLLTTPNPWAFHRFKQALVNDDVRCNSEHTAWFDERTLCQVLRRHGFAVDAVDYIRPSDAGVSQLLYDLGRETIGGTSLLVKASPA